MVSFNEKIKIIINELSTGETFFKYKSISIYKNGDLWLNGNCIYKKELKRGFLHHSYNYEWNELLGYECINKIKYIIEKLYEEALVVKSTRIAREQAQLKQSCDDLSNP